MSDETMTYAAPTWSRPTLSEEANRVVGLAVGVRLSLAVGKMLPLWVKALLEEVERERHAGKLTLGRFYELLHSDDWESTFEPVGREGQNWARGLSRWVWAQLVVALNEESKNAEFGVYVEVTVSLWGHDIGSDADETSADLWGNTYNGDFATELFDAVLDSTLGC